jgi:phosphopantothenoylcysteine decarboxylase
MNTLMYEHPLTSEHLRIVRDVVCYEVVGPIGKGLACGDVGMCQDLTELSNADFSAGLGAMTEWRDIVKIVVDKCKLVRPITQRNDQGHA